MRPAISVCVPTYNGVKYLRECLDSILVQSFENFEVIIVDDQSIDATFDLAQEYVARNARIRLFRNPRNLGMVGNWNRCLDLAEGDWIKYLFQDDRIVPHCLEHLFKESRPDVPLTVCQRDFLFDDVSATVREGYENLLSNFQVAKMFPDAGHISAERFCNASIDHLAVNFIGEPTAVMFHRDVPERFGWFNPEFIQICDFEYWARIASHTGFIAVPDTLASFRVHAQSTTAANGALRHFRTEVIDPLLLLYEFAYDRRFAPLRRVSRGRGVNLRRIVAEKAYGARTVAERDARDPLIDDPGPLNEWASLIVRYPNLKRSVYTDLYKMRDGLDRHVRWRFRREQHRLHNKDDFKVPVMVIVDMQPDEFFIDRKCPVPWTGYEAIYEFLKSARSKIARATGSAVAYLWTVRMDPQVAETYGAPDWVTRHYEKEIHDCQSNGDEIGIHTYAYRWDNTINNWLVDYGNQAWVNYCVESSFLTFRKVFGSDCRSFRFGDSWMNSETMRLVKELGAEFDLTLEPGQEPWPALFRRKPFSGRWPDLRVIPVTPYHPDSIDFSKSDPFRDDGIWVIPLSAAPMIEQSGRRRGREQLARQVKYQTLNLACEPEIFFFIANDVLTYLDRPYLTLIAKSAIGSYPRLLRNMKINLSHIVRHPMTRHFVFCTPAEAMRRLKTKSTENR
jgi:glycosyltransferase involved in cell wall biosynthesis